MIGIPPKAFPDMTTSDRGLHLLRRSQVCTPYILAAMFAVPFILTGCATSNSTAQSWSCRAVGNQACASIAEIDARPSVSSQLKTEMPIFGAKLAKRWDAQTEGVPAQEAPLQDVPRRASDQTMRIVLAPYVDAQGDYHSRSEVFAVMRKAQWWIIPSSAPSVSAAESDNKADAPLESTKSDQTKEEGADGSP